MALQVEQPMQDTFSVNESSYCFKETSGKINKMAVPALKGAGDKQGCSQGAGEAGSTSDGSLTQLSVGPAALAQLMIYQAINLYAKIIGLQSEERTNMVEAQVTCAQSQATETIAEGKASFDAALASGIMTITGAVASLAAYKAVDSSVNKDTTADMKELKPELDNMKVVEKNMSTIDTRGTAGDEQAVKYDDETEGKIESLKGDFKEHDYSRASEEPDITKKTLQRLKKDEEWKSEFNSKFDRNHRMMNSIVMRQSTVSNYSNMASTAANSLAQGGSSIAQGTGQQKSAEHRAAASLDGTSTQMAGGSASEFAQAMSKAYDAQVQEVQMLEKINQANSVDG